MPPSLHTMLILLVFVTNTYSRKGRMDITCTGTGIENGRSSKQSRHLVRYLTFEPKGLHDEDELVRTPQQHLGIQDRVLLLLYFVPLDNIYEWVRQTSTVH